MQCSLVFRNHKDLYVSLDSQGMVVAVQNNIQPVLVVVDECSVALYCLCLLLLLGGDIERNPGPPKSKTLIVWHIHVAHMHAIHEVESLRKVMQIKWRVQDIKESGSMSVCIIKELLPKAFELTILYTQE